MLSNKNSLHRRLRIVELVRKRGEVSVDELSQAFDVSSVTIRSDLTYLEQQRYLVRAFGRARYLAQRPEEHALTAPSDSVPRRAAELAIARMAAESVDDHAALFIGAGEVAHKVIPFLADRTNLALTLNDVGMLPTAQRFLHCELLLTGGALDGTGTVLAGPDAERTLSARALDMVVLEASGIDRAGNLLCSGTRLAQVFRAALGVSKRVVALAFQPKINHSEGDTFCHLSDLDTLVMDDALDSAAMELLLKAGLRIDRREAGIFSATRVANDANSRTQPSQPKKRHV
jgi:DeoR/GlpR family transcriptional regulator of sugar metabolism